MNVLFQVNKALVQTQPLSQRMLPPADEQHWFLRYIPRTCRPKHEIFLT